MVTQCKNVNCDIKNKMLRRNIKMWSFFYMCEVVNLKQTVINMLYVSIKYKMFYGHHRAKPMIDIRKIKGEESKHNTTENSSEYKGGQQEKNKGITKQPENGEQNSNSKFIIINNYFKCKQTKFSNQKTYGRVAAIWYELPYDPAVPLVGIYPKEMKTLSQRDICSYVFIASLFTIATQGTT